MFVAVSCVIVLASVLCTTAQALFTAPVPGFHGLSIYDVSDTRRVVSSAESNEVMTRGADKEGSAKAGAMSEDEKADEPEIRNEEQTVLVVEFESEPSEREDKERGDKVGKEGASDDSENQSPLDPWSIVWYIGSFGGLVAFFLIVSCSEWCCRRGARPLSSTYVQRAGTGLGDQHGGAASTGATETPPPPYHLFAPPPYDSVNYGELVDKASGEKIDIFVISVPLPSTAHQPAPA